ncbi:PhoH family protein [Candidatus Rhodoluna planktonica]|nr:PhoH family protein [Candidatus Rhodoluna planktonica]
MVSLLGASDQLLQALEQQFPNLDVMVRSNQIKLRGPADSIVQAKNLVEQLVMLIKSGQTLGLTEVLSSGKIIEANQRPADVLSQSILSSRGKSIRPKTLGQKQYVDAIDNHTIVFGIGPAGTGKTYLAMAKAVQALQRKEVSRIILTRPAVEAGERLGFLPGTLNDKIDPYLRPLFDALQEMLDADSVPKLMASGTIEVAPLAYMRGRTLNDSFIVLDEAQNTTPEQMKMFLTRLGFNSKMVVTGDITQIDLPGGASGLRSAVAALDQVNDLHFSYLSSEDVVRHSLVAKIVDAYTKFDEQQLVKKSRSETSANRSTAAVRPRPGSKK